LLLVSTGEQLAGQSQCLLVTSVTALKFGLTLCDEADNLSSSCPCMLNQSAVLKLDVETDKSLANFGVSVVFIDIVNTSIPRLFRLLYVIVFIRLVAKLVIESGFVEP